MMNRYNLEAGRRALERVESFSESPYEQNAERLMNILKENQHTAYGQACHFESIHSVSDFRDRLPLTEYDNYAREIEAMSERGESGLIYAGQIHHFNKSSGTLGIPKRIPISEKGLEDYHRFVEYLYCGIAEKYLGRDFSSGSSVCLIESTAEETRLPSQSSYSAISNKLIRMSREWDNLPFTSPMEAVFPVPGTDTRYLHARFALMDGSVTNMRATFFGFLLEFMRYIEQNWRILCSDIETGSITSGVKLPDSVRNALEKRLKPMPERADTLRRIFSEGFDASIMKKIWPRLVLIASIGSGSFQPYFDTMKQRYFGDTVDTMTLGYASSEGYFGVPFALNTEDCIFHLDNAFYEFLPVDAGGAADSIVTIKDVEVGKDYELIITNGSGFYRYRMEDVIRITGKYKDAPTFRFLYRKHLTANLMGEKTTEEMFTLASRKTAEALRFELIDYTVYEDSDHDPARYQIFMETANIPPEINPRDIRRELDRNLAEINPSYGEKLRRGFLSPLRVNFVEAESYALYQDLMIFSGTSASQIKPVHKIANERQRRFFFNATIYSSEEMK